MLKGYRVLHGPFLFTGAEADGDVGVLRASGGQCDGDGAEWLPCATIFGRAGGRLSQGRWEEKLLKVKYICFWNHYTLMDIHGISTDLDNSH